MAEDPGKEYSLTGANLPWEQQIVQAELEATRERESGFGNPFPGAALAGFKFNPDQQAQMMQAFTWAQQWMQAIGWKTQYMPTGAMLQAIVNAPWVNSYEQAANYFWGQLKNPHDQELLGFARYGMDKTTYENTAQSYYDVLEGLTGNQGSDAGFFKGVLDTALSQRWSTTKLREYLSNHPEMQKAYGYLKYGYNYEAWQQYLSDPTTKTKLQQRFGSSTAKNALADLEHPLVRVQSSGATVQQSQGMQQRQSTGMSEVR